MPLTKMVKFNAYLQKGNRIQIPKLIRWQFKMEPEHVLKVRVGIEGQTYGDEEFYARMSIDGRITIPKLSLGLLSEEAEVKRLSGHILEVWLEPAEGFSQKKNMREEYET